MQNAEEVLGPQVARLLDFLPDQPQRRAQMTDLLGWYKRQLDQLGVDVRMNTCLDADEIAAFGADHIALPTGSKPDPLGFQRAMTHLPTLPGIDRGRVWSPEDVLNLLTGQVTRIEADDLVMATANRADETLPSALAALGLKFQSLGNQAAPRMAALAFHDGRKWALGLH